MFENLIKKQDLNNKFRIAIENQNLETIKSLFAPLKELQEICDTFSEVQLNMKEKELLQHIPDINYDMVTTTAIMHAAQVKNWDIVEELFNLGADINVKVEPLNWYFIDECIVNAPLDLLERIIDVANINVKTYKGETPLMIALSRERYEAVDILLNEDKLIVSAVDKKKENIAHYAARLKLNDIFLRLVKRGVPILQKNAEGLTPLDLIEDELFRMSLPGAFEQLSKEGNEIILKADDKPIKVIEHRKLELKGLSQVHKMSF